MQKKSSYGVAIYNQNGDFLLLQNHGGYWGFPKGQPENDETPKQTAVRECCEETGIKILPDRLGEPFSYSYTQGEGGDKAAKTVILWLVQMNSTEIRIQSSEIKDFRWVSPEQAEVLIGLDSFKAKLLKSGQ